MNTKPANTFSSDIVRKNRNRLAVLFAFAIVICSVAVLALRLVAQVQTISRAKVPVRDSVAYAEELFRK